MRIGSRAGWFIYLPCLPGLRIRRLKETKRTNLTDYAIACTTLATRGATIVVFLQKVDILTNGKSKERSETVSTLTLHFVKSNCEEVIDKNPSYKKIDCHANKIQVYRHPFVKSCHSSPCRLSESSLVVPVLGENRLPFSCCVSCQIQNAEV